MPELLEFEDLSFSSKIMMIGLGYEIWVRAAFYFWCCQVTGQRGAKIVINLKFVIFI